METCSKVLNLKTDLAQQIGELNRAGVLRDLMAKSQPSDSAILSLSDSGAPALSILRRSAEDGSLLQTSLDADGHMNGRTLMHLPEHLSKKIDITMLKTRASGLPNKSENVRILLGVPPQDRYSFARALDAQSELSLPTVFERDVTSIKVVNLGMQNLIEGSSDASSSPRASKSAEDDEKVRGNRIEEYSQLRSS